MDRQQRRDRETDAEPVTSRRLAADDGDAAAAARQSDVQRRALAGDVVVQAKGAGASDAQVRASAGPGIAGDASALPHLQAIQQAFGSYDVSGVKAHVGPQAAESCEAMGASAYATGDHVAFARDPDLHTAAHEAAHVVQQSAGVHLAGGVGRDGDVHERHADAVADRVVAGESAEELLAEMAPATAITAGSSAVQMRKLPAGGEAFDEMWAAHPHNYQDDEGENTSSDQVREDHGLPAYLDNTCAIRLSIMLNGIGEKITPAKVAAAGIARRPHYSAKTKQFYILAANEMWTYLSKHFRKPDALYPASGRYKDEAEFNAAFDGTIRPAIQGVKGIVAFDKIFTYGGTGHVDLFDGERLSDAAGWYPCQKLHVWYVAVA